MTLSLLAFLACGSDPAALDSAAPAPSLADEAYTLLIGNFDSTAQSETDRSYYAISLIHCPVALDALGERVLYVEQALADTPDEPYRQRLYTVVDVEGGVATRLFELADPDAAIGACEDTAAVSWSVDTLAELEGCGVVLEPAQDGFVGSTVEDQCQSDYGGAAYATAQVTLTDAQLTSWDQGWSAAGEQVWGATAGPYVFDRLSAPGAW